MPSPMYSADLNLEEPSPKVQEYALHHCGEDPDTRLKAISDLRDIIYERGECTPHRMDDEFLIRFLRARKFIPQRAHRLMVNYYQFKEDNTELFEDIYPLDLRVIGDSNVLTVPPYLAQDDRRLLIYRIGCWDPNAIPTEDLFKATLMAMELGMMEPTNQILGAHALFDLEDIGLHHAWQTTPAIASKIVKMLGSCFPVNTYAIHIINHSWVFDKIYNIFKPFLTADMRSKIHFHGYDVTSLHKHILPDHLPERYGGIWPDFSYTIWLESLKKNHKVAKEMITCGYKFREEELCPKVVRQLKDERIKLS
ncbi:alpha-tocopherol transfer protein-like [Choristoneura fumiferana]|uniref:alpha-tocopherol transfer protein-like n=1 Tax=Choristoneura fumiferana TaxID=7141 RepID=UPI003D156B7F